LLANVLLDEVDRELERSAQRFVRYADDCNVYVRSQRAGERVLGRLRQLYGRLRLSINEAKSAVAPVWQRSFLGFTFWRRDGQTRYAVSRKAIARYKERIRHLTRRTRGRSMEQVVKNLREYMLGWKGYFQLAQTPRVFGELDGWLRHRLRALYLKQWKRGSTIYRELRALGVTEWLARQVAANSRCWWSNAAKVTQQCHADRAFRPNRRPAPVLTSTSRTARCGPARRVVWEGSSPYALAPIPIW
jgi:hypothetical protein